MTDNKLAFVKIIVGVLFILMLTPLWNLDAKETAEKKKPPKGANQPIEIVSDRMDARNDKKLVVFSGNAVATQGDRVIKSDQLLLYYRKDPGKVEKSPSKTGTDLGGDLEKIEAKGHVIVTQGQRIVTGDSAVFIQATQKVVMTGNAVMQEGSNIIKGNRIIVFLNEDRGIVESDHNKRVRAVIYPDKDNDK
jgi:lipopolysaccharide export system protein LptA